MPLNLHPAGAIRPPLLPLGTTCGALLFMLFGCGPSRPAGELPELQPVRGTVVVRGEPAEGGLLVWRSETTSAESNLMVGGVVEPDGGYTLATTHALSQRKGAGAPVGRYRVTYLPPGEDQNIQPFELPTPVEIVNGENAPTLEFP